MESKTVNTALLILAAGNSSRLGRPKQLLQSGDSHLLERIMLEAESVPFQQKVLVLGAYSEIVSRTIHSSSFQLVTNENWKEGMGSSIQVGMGLLLENSAPDQVIIAVCDQPFLGADQFRLLMETGMKSEKGIVASSYEGTIGVPVLFKKNYFKQLLALQGQGGAKQLVRQFHQDVATVPFALGHIDIDTEEDYKAYLRNDRGYFIEKHTKHEPANAAPGTRIE